MKHAYYTIELQYRKHHWLILGRYKTHDERLLAFEKMTFKPTDTVRFGFDWD